LGFFGEVVQADEDRFLIVAEVVILKSELEVACGEAEEVALGGVFGIDLGGRVVGGAGATIDLRVHGQSSWGG
jgi:hypothetical protein